MGSHEKGSQLGGRLSLLFAERTSQLRATKIVQMAILRAQSAMHFTATNEIGVRGRELSVFLLDFSLSQAAVHSESNARHACEVESPEACDDVVFLLRESP
jgi:hypothetical protein